MPASVVGAARTPSNGTDATGASLALTIPAGTAVDDYAVIVLELWDSTTTNPTITYPAGFSQIVNYVSTTDGFEKLKVAIKKLTAADSGTYSTSGFASHFRQGHVVILRGIDTTTALDVAVNLAQNSTGTGLPANSLTTVTDGCLLMRVIANENLSTGTPDTGYTEQLDSNYTKTNTKVAGAAGTETPTGGAQSVSNLKLSALIAFRPASSGTAMNLDAATGSGAAQALSAAKDLPLGQTAGSGAAQALAPAKALTLGAAAGTGTPQAMTFSKALGLGAAAGSGAAQAASLTAASSVDLGPATGTGSPQPMTFSKALALGVATGAGAPAAIAAGKSLTLDTAAGAGAAQALAPGKALGLQTAAGSGAAQPMAAVAAGSMALGPALGAGAPQAMTFSKAWGLGTAAGSGAVQQLAPAKALTLGAVAATGGPRGLSLAKQLTYGAAQGLGTPFALELEGPLPDFTAPESWVARTLGRTPVAATVTAPAAAGTQLRGFTARTRDNRYIIGTVEDL